MPGRVRATWIVDPLAIPLVVPEPLTLRAEEPFALTVRRAAGDHTRLRLRLGTETIAEVPAGAEGGSSALLPWLRDECGESRVVVERATEEMDDRYEPLFELNLAVEARPEVARDFRILVSEVGAIHQGLARDVIGRSTMTGHFRGDPVALLDPEAQLQTLGLIRQRFTDVLARIAGQPSVALESEARLQRYRGGDRCPAQALAGVVRDPHTCLDPHGRIAHVGKVLVRSVHPGVDVPEHRHIAEGLRRLALRADGLARHCQRAAELLRMEEDRWGSSDGTRPSVFAQRDLPRIRALEGHGSAARSQAEAIRDLLRQHRFLAKAGTPRTTFGPTPAFLGRPAYREAFRLLCESRRLLGLVVDADAVRFVCRSLATLHEYWCYLRTVAHLRERFGAPAAQATFTLVDDIYRPELAPGQEFRFDLGRDLTVSATYQPEFRPWSEARDCGDRYAAALTRNPLRPDILLTVTRGRLPPVLLVLDAKVTDFFTPLKLREQTDYARQVFDLQTGRQPIRQVFFLHRDRRTPVLTNVPGYLKGRHIDRSVMVLGAVRCVPEGPQHSTPWLERVIDRFLEVYAAVPPAAPVS
jgi:hypothetical protein